MADVRTDQRKHHGRGGRECRGAAGGTTGHEYVAVWILQEREGKEEEVGRREDEGRRDKDRKRDCWKERRGRRGGEGMKERE